MIKKTVNSFLWILCGIVVLSIVVFIVESFVSWGECEENEIWFESIEVKPNVFIEVIHTKGCRLQKPYFAKRIKIDSHFSKNKNDVFDYCVDDDLALILNAISYRYNKNFIQWAWFFDDTNEERNRTDKRIEHMDTSFCVRDCQYGYSFGNMILLDSIIEVKKIIENRYFFDL